MNRPLSCWIEARIHCRDCLIAAIACPTCGNPWAVHYAGPPVTFPADESGACPCCGTVLHVRAIGWEGPGPAALSERLELERAYRRPAARRVRPAAVAAPPAPPPRPPRPAPCPPGTPRHRLACWAAAGLLPDGVAPSSIAAAYARATGCPPARDRHARSFRAYSPAELALALAELGHPPPPGDPLASIWAATLARLELPSTRMLLSQQGCLLELTPAAAVVGIRGGWLAMVDARAELLAQALAAAIGRPVALLLQGLEVQL